MEAKNIEIAPWDYDAVLFDLDGVLSKTATIHAAAWKKLFDSFLEQYASREKKPFVPFDIDSDYVRYIDGKTRTDGVESFLDSRGIRIPSGTPEDGANVESIHSLGNKKDQYFLQHIKEHGVELYDSSIALVRSLRAQDIKTAVVSSSNHCADVLEAGGIARLFDTRVDGKDVTRLKLRGKPAPDAFLEAARRLGAAPSRCIVVEDAAAGIEAGRAGKFGFCIGVDHKGNEKALRDAGADVVVTDLAQVAVTKEPQSSWVLVYDDFDPAQEGKREALCSLGNGYFTTRGAVFWTRANDIHYPGTYIAGCYNRLNTEVSGKVVEHEDLVNFPNWLLVEFHIGTDNWFDLQNVKILSYHQELDLQQGILSRNIRFEDGAGRRSTLAERRLVSISDMHLCVLEIKLTAENWSDVLTMRSGVDGHIVNAGERIYRKFKNSHIHSHSSQIVDKETVSLLVTTSQSDIHVAQAARMQLFIDGKPVEVYRRQIDEEAYIGQEFEITIKQGETLALEKVVSVYTSRDHAISECGLQARKTVARAGRFDALMSDHCFVWKHLWRHFDIHIQAIDSGPDLNIPMLLRLNMFHLLQTVSPNSIGLDIGVPARGWTGEAYLGHIFWDELFIFPFINYRVPEITRSLLMYRYRRLPEARAAAAEAGYKGAMFPWQSGSDGREETLAFNLNPRSQRWIADHTYLQRHIGSAIVYNVWQYFQVTNDIEFLYFHGAELILSIACFWSSAATFNKDSGRYEIHGVMGPDEFHDGYPDANKPGLNNNAYTNLMAVWVLCRALEVIDLLSGQRRDELTAKLGLTADEINRWGEISRLMYLPFQDDGIISQFDGYEKLDELDSEHYKMKYGNIQRLDLILESENDSPNRYKVAKQPDVLMLFYLFSAEEISELFERLGYRFETQNIPENISYYVSRSSFGSTLSRVVCSWVLARSDRQQAMGFFIDALQSDVSDIQHGTTAEGIHLGAMAGTVDEFVRVLTGIEVRGGVLRFNPELPQGLKRLDMQVRYRGHSLVLKLTADSLTVHSRGGMEQPIQINVKNEICKIESGATHVVRLAI
jgi:beta-phosphoglucomutase family hydrolase